MNRFDIIHGKSPPPKKKEKPIIPEYRRGIDLGDGDSETALVLMQGMQVTMVVQSGQSLQIGDNIGVDESGRAVLVTNESAPIGVVIDPVRAAAQIEQDQDSVVVGRTSRGQSTRGYLHEHPELQQELGVDEDHIIVDRRDWERARLTLAGRNDSYTETIETSFSPDEEEEEPNLLERLDDEWSDHLPF